jgi:hypothetical protein
MCASTAPGPNRIATPPGPSRPIAHRSGFTRRPSPRPRPPRCAPTAAAGLSVRKIQPTSAAMHRTSGPDHARAVCPPPPHPRPSPKSLTRAHTQKQSDEVAAVRSATHADGFVFFFLTRRESAGGCNAQCDTLQAVQPRFTAKVGHMAGRCRRLRGRARAAREGVQSRSAWRARVCVPQRACHCVRVCAYACVHVRVHS